LLGRADVELVTDGAEDRLFGVGIAATTGTSGRSIVS
jgi:hypothetical protein